MVAHEASESVPEPEPEPDPEPEPEPEPESSGGIPGFTFEAVLAGLLVFVLLIRYSRN